LSKKIDHFFVAWNRYRSYLLVDWGDERMGLDVLREGTGSGPPKVTLASAVYLRLKRDIINGDLQPGSKLKIRDLCQRMDVGLSPVREALSRLSAEGFVRQIDQRGFSVATIDEAGLADLMRARCWLNEIGLRKSIEHGGPDWEERVLVAHHHLTRAPNAPAGSDDVIRTPEWSAAHLRFHQALISASGSDWLSSFCEQLHEAMERYRHVSRSGRTRQSADSEHRAIMEAALDRDAPRAVALLTEHFEKTAALGQAALKKGSWTD